eukprot:5149635-Amphidinium_carterae.1
MRRLRNRKVNGTTRTMSTMVMRSTWKGTMTRTSSTSYRWSTKVKERGKEKERQTAKETKEERQ